jgi:hypothetical protein
MKNTSSTSHAGSIIIFFQGCDGPTAFFQVSTVAPQIFVQLIRESDRLNIVNQSNGQGLIQEYWKIVTEQINIHCRIGYTKKKLDVRHRAGKGTQWNTEFNVCDFWN